MCLSQITDQSPPMPEAPVLKTHAWPVVMDNTSFNIQGCDDKICVMSKNVYIVAAQKSLLRKATIIPERTEKTERVERTDIHDDTKPTGISNAH